MVGSPATICRKIREMVLNLKNIYFEIYIFKQSYLELPNIQLSYQYLDCRGAVARVRDSHTDDPSSIPVRLVVASW